MQSLWTEELTKEEETTLIQKLASEITRRGLQAPAVVFLEMHKPLSGLAMNGAIVFSPFVAPFFGIDNVHNYSRLLGNRDSVERLIREIESPRTPQEGPQVPEKGAEGGIDDTTD